MEMADILQVQHLSKQFGGLKAVDQFSMDVREHSIHALIGPNGAGKTTITNLICGEIEQNEGDILFQGESLTGLKVYQRAERGIGRTYQNIRLFDSLTVVENLEVAARIVHSYGMLKTILSGAAGKREKKERRDKSMEVLGYLGMEHLANETVRGLPYGNRKILEIGRALVTDPQLLLLDEPAAGLNPSERKRLVDIIYKIHGNGVSIFMIEHNMDVIMTISDKITVLNFGKKIAEGTPKEIQNNEEVITAYLGNRFRKQGVEVC